MENFINIWPSLTWLFTGSIITLVPFIILISNSKLSNILFGIQIILFAIQLICFIIFLVFR